MIKERTSQATDSRPKRTAAEWFVVLDRDGMSGSEAAELAAWLAEGPENEEAFTRCQAAALLASRLRGRPGLRWAFEEATELATRRAPDAQRARAQHWYQRPGPAWAVAGLALVVAMVAALRPYGPGGFGQSAPLPVASGVMQSEPVSAGASAPAVEGAAETDLAGMLAIELPLLHRVALLSGDVIVDARSVAVLPFKDVAAERSGGSGPLAETAGALSEAIVRQLARLPGVYVAAEQSAAGYSGVELDAEEIAVQLGVRGIVEGWLEADAERVRLYIRLTDAVNQTVIDRTFEHPREALSAMQTDVTRSIAVALSSEPRPEARPTPLEPLGEIL